MHVNSGRRGRAGDGVGADSPLLPTRQESILTIPNAITLARTGISVPLALLAMYHQSWAWLVAAYLVYWVGDMLDGVAARQLGQETVIGAILDIVSDRACTTLAAAALVQLDPDAALPLAVFLLQFCVVDMMLSMAFVPLGVRSPNYFFRVDQTIYNLNWSSPAKALNTSLVVIACVAGLYWIATAIATVLLIVKIVSVGRLMTVIWPRTVSQSMATIG